MTNDKAQTRKLAQQGLIARDGIIVLETAKGEEPDLSPYHVFDVRNWGAA